MTDLRKLARGQTCKIRVPGECIGGTETTVLCHVKERWCGSIKPPDICAIHGCVACHDVFDGRRQTHYTREQLDHIALGALCEQLRWYAENNVFDKSMNTGPSKSLPRRYA